MLAALLSLPGAATGTAHVPCRVGGTSPRLRPLPLSLDLPAARGDKGIVSVSGNDIYSLYFRIIAVSWHVSSTFVCRCPPLSAPIVTQLVTRPFWHGHTVWMQTTGACQDKPGAGRTASLLKFLKLSCSHPDRALGVVFVCSGCADPESHQVSRGVPGVVQNGGCAVWAPIGLRPVDGRSTCS